MSEEVKVQSAENGNPGIDFDPDALRAKYREERDRRIRTDGNEQYVEVQGDFSRYVDDPYVDPGFTRTSAVAWPGALFIITPQYALSGAVATRTRGIARACAAAFVLPGGAGRVVEGRLYGQIAPAPRGANGFGYDPVFVIAGDGRTMAELASEEKHRVSHRGLAGAKLRARLAGG